MAMHSAQTEICEWDGKVASHEAMLLEVPLGLPLGGGEWDWFLHLPNSTYCVCLQWPIKDKGNCLILSHTIGPSSSDRIFSLLYLEMPAMKPGTFCIQSRCFSGELHFLPLQSR